MVGNRLQDAVYFLLDESAVEVETTKVQEQKGRRLPLLFCCAILTPIVAIVVLGELVVRFLPSPPYSRSTVDNVTFYFVAAEILLSFGFVVRGWIRGERPRFLAFIAVAVNILVLHYVFVTSNQAM
jgi:hypothetical protein